MDYTIDRINNIDHMNDSVIEHSLYIIKWWNVKQ